MNECGTYSRAALLNIFAVICGAKSSEYGMYLLRVLIGSLDNLCLLRLVLVLRHSFKKYSINVLLLFFVIIEVTTEAIVPCWFPLIHQVTAIPTES